MSIIRKFYFLLVLSWFLTLYVSNCRLDRDCKYNRGCIENLKLKPSKRTFFTLSISDDFRFSETTFNGISISESLSFSTISIMSGTSSGIS